MKISVKRLSKSLGLNSQEAQVYLSALELGQASVQAIAQKSGVKRTTLYGFLPQMKERGFIFETKKAKRKVYSAADPEHLLELSKLQVKELEQSMPELLALHNRSSNKPRVTFYEGVKGLQEVYADTLKEKKPIVAWSDFDHLAAVMGSKFCEEYPLERSRRNITFKSILRDSPVAREIALKNEPHLRETKYIHSGDLRTEINIYGDKVALMSFRSHPPFVVLIEDHDLAETLRVAWKNLWEKL